MNDVSTKVLLVEDDPNLGDILQEYLNLKGYKTTLCKNGMQGYEAFHANDNFHICILDVMMPVMDGFTLAEKIRQTDTQVPIIFLTARNMKEDKVKGFKLGADDYIPKPFSMEELQLRMEAVLRRTRHSGATAAKAASDRFVVGKFVFNPLQQMLSFDEEEYTKLTTKESALLKLLCMHKNNVLSRELALTTIWGEDNYFTARSMDVFITKLRKHLKKDPDVGIMNVHGKGYKLVDL